MWGMECLDEKSEKSGKMSCQRSGCSVWLRNDIMSVELAGRKEKSEYKMNVLYTK